VRERINRDNCVSLYLYTMAAGPAELQCHAEDFILSHFEQVGDPHWLEEKLD
jgi:hypothetical protein